MSKQPKKMPRTPPVYDSIIHGNEHLNHQPEEIQDIWYKVALAPEDVKSEIIRKVGHIGLREVAPKLAPVSDGPGSRFTFGWNGQQICFARAPLRYRLLEALWDKSAGKPHKERDFQEVLNYVYGEDSEADGAMRELCSQVTRSFRQEGIGLEVRRRSGKIWLDAI